MVCVDPCLPLQGCVAERPVYPQVNEIWEAATATLRLAGAANETLAFQLILEANSGALQGVSLEGLPDCAIALGRNLALPIAGRFIDDAVLPLHDHPAKRVRTHPLPELPWLKGRKRETFTVELVIPRGMRRGRHTGALIVKASGVRHRLKVALRVYGFELPDGNRLTADINNYSFLPYPGVPDANVNSDRYIAVQNRYFQMARQHRCGLHLLPYRQSGRLEPGYVPTTVGWGRNRRIVDWTAFDRQWGALLDGSAFRGCPGGARPLDYFYTPVNLMWPAHLEHYGKPGFQVEYQNGIRQMAEHFARKKWTATTFEIFFNHKARWKYFPWDMDEIYYERDNDATIQFARWATEAAAGVPGVKVVNRIDSSWIFDRSARTEIAETVQLWVVGAGALAHAPDEVGLLRRKGRTVWFYCGADRINPVTRRNNMRWPWLAWGRETDGFTWWNGVGWGSWEHPGCGTDHCFYDGWHFGVEGPLASLRLKALHRGMQDAAYLELLEARTGSRAAADAVVAATIGCRGREAWYQRGERAEVSGAEIQTASRSAKAWNSAPDEAWQAARAGLAAAIEQA
jgi:PAS domain-containing protein